MATDKEFIEYVAEQLGDYFDVTYKKMFGEYMIYIDAKPVLLVCDNAVFVKMHEALKALLEKNDTGYPYPGSKLHYVVDVDDGELLKDIVNTILPITPLKKR